MDLTLEELEKDKVKLEQSLRQAQAQALRLDGALAYVNDNIIKLKKEVEEDAGTGTAN